MLRKTLQVVLDCMAPLGDAGVIDFSSEEAMPMDEAFYAVVDAGEEIRSLGDAHRFLEMLAVHFGVRNLAYLGVNVPRPGENRPVFGISTYSKAWVDRYRARNYQRIDPVLPESMKGILPLDWRNLPPLRPAALRFFGEAYDYGVQKQGLSIPIRGAKGDLAVFTVNADLADTEWEHFTRKNTREFLLIAFYYHQQVMALEGFREAVDIRELSQRERDMLWWTAEGKTTKEIALILGLSDRTVRFYIENAMTKLRCHSKAQCVARAIRIGAL
jgi:DNA-binding CsgD family transcriptional regulator